MMMMTNQIRKNVIIFAAKLEFSEYRPTDAISNHKSVDPLPKIDVRNIFNTEYYKKYQANFEYDSKQ